MVAWKEGGSRRTSKRLRKCHEHLNELLRHVSASAERSDPGANPHTSMRSGSSAWRMNSRYSLALQNPITRLDARTVEPRTVEQNDFAAAWQVADITLDKPLGIFIFGLLVEGPRGAGYFVLGSGAEVLASEAVPASFLAVERINLYLDVAGPLLSGTTRR